MKYLDYLIKENSEYLQKAEAYTRDYFITKNRDLMALHQQGIVIKSKDFDNIWSKALKVVLWEKQNKRCCLCEKKLNDVYSTDVEHYRPKVIYWWLAYNYMNYYLACAECNRKYKQTKFPLFDETQKIDYTTRKNIKAEQPLLINPLFDNPRDYFRLHFRYASNTRTTTIMTLIPKEKKGNNYNYQKAKTSIDVYNLDLSDYDKSRHETLRDFFNKLIKIAVYHRVFWNKDKAKFLEFYNDFTADDDRKELRKLGLTRMILRGQFIIDPYILSDYCRKYKFRI